MLVVFRTRGVDWDRFAETLRAHLEELRRSGCSLVEAYRNRNHPAEWVMLQRWPDKATFDRFAAELGPRLDLEAGVDWTDVSTWEASALPAPHLTPGAGEGRAGTCRSTTSPTGA